MLGSRNAKRAQGTAISPLICNLIASLDGGVPRSRKAMTADAGMVDQRAVGHRVSGRKKSQMTRKREVCLFFTTPTSPSMAATSLC